MKHDRENRETARWWLIGLAALGLSAWGWSAVSQTAPLFTLNVSPESPVAGERITITAEPANFTATSTSFSWFRDGKKLDAASGMGRSSLSITTEAPGPEVIRVRLEVDPGTGFGRGEEAVTIYTLAAPQQGGDTVSDITSDFTLEASNQNPDAGETVSVEVITFAFDKNAASFQWYVNGALDRAQSGRGRFRFSLSAPAEGTARTVRVDVATPGGQVRSKSITIQTASSPFYWWADTTVPYWYKGKALPSIGSRVTVMVLPNVRAAAQLSYQWHINDSVASQASGVGRQTYSFRLTVPIEEKIAVRMRDLAGAFDKAVSTGIGPAEPLVGLYALQPLRGVAYETALDEFSAPSGDPHEFIAAPFFFPKTTSLSYRWRLNNRDIIGEPPDPWRFILTSKQNTPALDALSIAVEDPARPAVRANADAAIQLR